MIEYISTTPYYLDLAKAQTQQLNLAEIRLLVNTTGAGAMDVFLPNISQFPVQNVKLYIVDYLGNALVNNITIHANGINTIGDSSTLVINANKGAVKLEIGSANEWISETGGGSGSVIPLTVSMTYAELTAAIGASNLITGQKIILTDYATSYYLQYSGPGPTGIGGEEINVGAVEPLLLTAISSTEISMVAESISNPQDLILYLVTVADKDYDYAASSGTGCIIKRIDRKLDVSRDYDWRTILFRRWETVIGNGNFWSYKPVAGADFIDSLCFGTNVSAKKNISINSPLLLSSAIGAPYQLDNTILNFELCLKINIGLAFGNTFIHNGVGSLSMSLIEIGSCLDNIVFNSSFSVNKFSIFDENTIVDLVESQLGNCNVGFFIGNEIESVENITASSVQNNIVSSLFNNTCDIIYNNNLPGRSISGNICNEITDNSNTGGDISDNICNTISNNTNTGGITGNIAIDISANFCQGGIANNTMNVNIFNNSNIGSIQNNSGNSINDNLGQGNIQGNNVGVISLNNCLDIQTNTGITINGNVLTGVIRNNTVGIISGNTETVLSQIEGCSGASFTNNSLAGNYYRLIGNVDSCNIDAAIQVHTFVSEISNKVITPTGSMSGTSPTQSIVDQVDGMHYIMLLAGGALTFPTAITN